MPIPRHFERCAWNFLACGPEDKSEQNIPIFAIREFMPEIIKCMPSCISMGIEFLSEINTFSKGSERAFDKM